MAATETAVSTENGDRNTAVSSNGPSGGGYKGPHLMGTELVSIPLKIESKRLYISLRENERGRFLKISEAETSSGQRHKMIVPAQGIARLKDLITRVAEEDQRLGASTTNKSEIPQNDNTQRGPPKPLYTERMTVAGRRFFLDLLVNSRGRYFKLSHVPLTGGRVQITLPASGLTTFASTIQKVLDDTPGADGNRSVSASGVVTENGKYKGGSIKELAVENKRLLFQTGTNNRGSFLRLIEKPGSNSVMMPIDCLPDVVDILLEITGAREEEDEEDTDENDVADDSAQKESNGPVDADKDGK